MTVAELIDRLENCDPEATVRIMMQDSWLFENSIRGIAQRSDFASASENAIAAAVNTRKAARPSTNEYGDPELAGNDIFIVEGRQERYGSKAAWEVCRLAFASTRRRGAARRAASLRPEESGLTYPPCCPRATRRTGMLSVGLAR